jgi:putative selenate reductase
MAELTGIDLGTHLKAIVAEYESHETIYGYPKRKFYLGHQGFDFGVNFHGKRAETPLGPAAGPHTQMVQNIILSFLGGGRIMELKTVQILDQLEIGRPCIDARNVGYNIEWSQELRLSESYKEYVAAWVLLKIIEEIELLGIPKGDPFYDTVFDMSVGYDLDGISSPDVHNWIAGMKDAGPAIEEMLKGLPLEFEHLRNLPVDPCISNTLTLSTFHGCPPPMIESITEHLISEHGLDVIVKKNPTLLGYEQVSQTLRGDLGYRHIELNPKDFADDLHFEDGVAMMKRLEKFAAKHGVNTGSKFTNTLVVKNNQDYFAEETMYLSGAPLHVLSMHTMQEFRKQMGPHYHTSFSAGITNKNVADSVSCGMRPVTVCTDLLKTGGYTRMALYLKDLRDGMEALEVSTLDEFIIRKADEPGCDSVDEAAIINLNALVPTLVDNPLYHYEANQKDPPSIDSDLVFFDCITCNKCLPVCPNAANFYLSIGEMDVETKNFELRDGKFVAVAGSRFELKKKAQIANLADFCNECGDCDPYCPERGGPFVQKPRFFFNRETYELHSDYDGFYFPGIFTLKGRYNGKPYTLEFDPATKGYHWESEEVELHLDAEDRLVNGAVLREIPDGSIIEMEVYYRLKALLHGVIDHPSYYTSIMLRGT